MGALYPNRNYISRARSLETNEWVYGNHVEMMNDSIIHAYIYPWPRNPNSGNHSYTPQPVDCNPETVQRFTGLNEWHGDGIYEHDIVEIPNGQRGEVCFTIGTWGVHIEDYIDWDSLETIVDQKRYGNTPQFLMNDNFISFYELIDNFCSEDACDNYCSAVISVTAAEDDLREFREAWKISE